MQLVETSPVSCLCGRWGAPLVEMPYQVPGLTGWAHLCRDCVTELFGLFAAVPLVEHQRIIDGFNATVAKRDARISALTDAEREAGELREQLEALTPLVENHQSTVLALEQMLAEAERKREEAEKLAAGQITVAGFRHALAEAVAKGWAGASSGAVDPDENEPHDDRPEVQSDSRTCPECGEPFMPSRADQAFCKPACRQRAYRRRQAEEGVPA
jgi:hypothetical protein